MTPDSFRVLVLNPGSTSTKVALFEGREVLRSEELEHGADLAPFQGQPIPAQLGYREGLVRDFLRASGHTLSELHAVAARGGLLRPVSHGTYCVNPAMLADLRAGVGGQHAANLGGLIAQALVNGTGVPAFIVDPPVVDELDDRARITGLKSVRRKAISHALNQVATAHAYAERQQRAYDSLNLIVAHLGGGISVGAHRKGRCVDVNDALGGEGPFTPQRAGSLPAFALVDLCFSGASRGEVRRLLVGKGGLVDLVGSADLRALEARCTAGDAEAHGVMDALVYRIAREIASLWPAFDGEPVDQILLTGGMARSARLVEALKNALAAMPAGLTIYPGEREMLALVEGALRVLEGKEAAKEYAVCCS